MMNECGKTPYFHGRFGDVISIQFDISLGSATEPCWAIEESTEGRYNNHQ
jgi:hypothetical protein